MIRFIIKTAFVVILIYVGVSLAIPWVKYYIYKNAFNNIIYSEKRFPDFDVKKNLLEEAKDLKIPITAKDIKINVINFKKIYTVEYVEKVSFPYVKKTVTFKFILKGEKDIEGENG
ncbi:hypothetical protein FHQ18_08365 [Deferribacter autotrophicus]|uniref:DUF4845 domain-containing protein n=1 Tax=Deferribacter autotrophicus TaxID=500465 RepID=A0A5A8F6W8_9BACT|nr:hypothetical protein [Deferribacter autotrophicus]KAA0257745.1 hypothetical protein FHQ18_08365 [Deferribacter autotrophicus]